jgi:hypothetical protein
MKPIIINITNESDPKQQKTAESRPFSGDKRTESKGQVKACLEA